MSNSYTSKSPEDTDWSMSSDQQLWFDRFKSISTGGAASLEGIKFSQFQEFLRDTLYTHFASLASSDRKTSEHDASCKFSYQQELQLFSAFDINNDHLIDREEFSHLCLDWLDKTYRRAWALVVVDVQNDFIDGSLALINGPARQDGAEVVPVINTLIDSGKFEAIAYTLDWHPRDHIGFHSNLHLRKYTLKQPEEPNTSLSSRDKDTPEISDTSQTSESRFKLKKLTHEARVFDSVLFDDGRMEQKLWPVHCIQNSWGAELHPKLKIVPNAIRVLKGTLSHLDAYSAFWDNMRLNETGLRQELSSRKINDVFFCGVALDYCVAASALDSAKAGFMTLLIEDACRGLDAEEMGRRKAELSENGVLIINSDSIVQQDFEMAKRICFKRAFLNGGSKQ